MGSEMCIRDSSREDSAGPGLNPGSHSGRRTVLRSQEREGRASFPAPCGTLARLSEEIRKRRGHPARSAQKFSHAPHGITSGGESPAGPPIGGLPGRTGQPCFDGRT